MTRSSNSDREPPKRALQQTDDGAPGADDAALPDGITSRIVREYQVGPYRYTDLAQAIAERDRQRMISKD